RCSAASPTELYCAKKLAVGEGHMLEARFSDGVLVLRVMAGEESLTGRAVAGMVLRGNSWWGLASACPTPAALAISARMPSLSRDMKLRNEAVDHCLSPSTAPPPLSFPPPALQWWVGGL